MKKICTLLLGLILGCIGSNSFLGVKSYNAKADLGDYKAKMENASLNDPGILELYNTVENEEEIFLEDHYATYYYKNLTENFGKNEYGSCGYVAIGMLLSYWDVCWDDNMIPENYEMITMLDNNSVDLSLESPGILREPDSLVKNLNCFEYYQVIEQYSNFYFQLKLIQMGKEYFGQYRFDATNSPASMTYADYIELLEYYLYTYRNYTRQQVEIRSCALEDSNTNSDDVRAYAINLIKQGIPVKLGVANTLGHAVIAYDYDEENDEIYAHTGWGANETHIALSDAGYTQYLNAIAIVFKPGNAHVCSDNFKYSNQYETLETYCACDFDVHPTKSNYNITYANLIFQGTTASVLKDWDIIKPVPTSYSCISGLNLSGITASWPSAGVNTPQLMFIGWCSDSALTQTITAIPQYTMGNITLYAKWRYDYNSIDLMRNYTITAESLNSDTYDDIYLRLDIGDLYQNLVSIGINYLAIDFNIRLQTTQGAQIIKICGGSEEQTRLKQIQFSYGTNREGVYSTMMYIPLEDLEGMDFLYIYYGVNSQTGVWTTDRAYLGLMYVTEQNDVDAVPFTWESHNPFD